NILLKIKTISLLLNSSILGEAYSMTNNYEECSLATDSGNDTERSLYRDGELRCREIIFSCK
ncbi:MAG: hypothetical protein WBH03_13640, partial [Cyclobacteriaceae bacterium]